MWKQIFVLLCIAQAANAQWSDVDSLYRQQRYADAAFLCERKFFDSTDSLNKADALLLKGACLKAAEHYSEAFKTFTRISNYRLDDRRSYKLRYEAALCAYLSNDFSGADFQLLQINQLQNQSYADSCLLLRCLTDLELEQWDAAHTHIIRYANIYHLAFDSAQFIRSEKELDLKNEKKAQRLSLIIPGLGQCYAGKPWQGLASFLLTTGSLAFATLSIIDGYYVSGTLAGGGSAFRFYTGGARHSRRLVREYNARKTEQYKTNIRKLLLPDTL